LLRFGDEAGVGAKIAWLAPRNTPSQILCENPQYPAQIPWEIPRPLRDPQNFALVFGQAIGARKFDEKSMGMFDPLRKFNCREMPIASLGTRLPQLSR
jgi:hypothetical protein